VNFESGLCVSGWLGILKAATLVNCNVNQNSARLHLLDQSVGHKLWSFGSWNQNGTNHKVGFQDGTFNFKCVAGDCL
jgi:hypothetical protein